jgi:hypothetical protein
MPIALFIKTKCRNLANIFDQKSALEGIFLVADQANTSGEKSSKTMLLR